MFNQFGVSLIEVVISLLLLSLILLGLNAMQITALRTVKSAYYFSVAAQQLMNMVNRLDSLKEVDRAKEMALWNEQNSEVLPDGMGIVRGYYPYISLVIFWGGAAEQTCKANKMGQSGCLYFE